MPVGGAAQSITDGYDLGLPILEQLIIGAWIDAEFVDPNPGSYSLMKK